MATQVSCFACSAEFNLTQYELNKDYGIESFCLECGGSLVIKTDGKIVGYSATGGVIQKELTLGRYFLNILRVLIPIIFIGMMYFWIANLAGWATEFNWNIDGEFKVPTIRFFPFPVKH